ncbi:putative protein YagA [subsurface metagenome]
MNVKDKEKKERYDILRELYYNKGLSIKDLANYYRRSERTIYRWIKFVNQENSLVSHNSKKNIGRPKKYSPEIFNWIIKLKEELPQRSAPLVYKILKKEFPTTCPSVSTIRKYIQEQGLTYKSEYRKQGYIKFERKQPNDLWQIDIAGVQTVGHLMQVFLFALLDDCSRFIMAAEYFRNQRGTNVIKIIRDAVMAYGRPNEILADNGTQFRNVIGELGTKYSKLLESMDIKPIFAKPYHPQTKGKLERWFGTVNQMFLIEGRHYVNNNPRCSLADFNQKFKEWVNWYNIKKPHRSLPNKSPPANIFFETEDRIFRPLQAKVNWDRWLYELTQRKVNKYNQISYKSQKFDVPPGFSGSRIDVIEYEEKIEFYYKDKLLITHPYQVSIKPKKKVKLSRKIRQNGTISYKGKWYNIDYKLARKTVEVQETNLGKSLLVYLNGLLIKTLDI